MNRIIAIAVSTTFLLFAVPCWAQLNSKENPVPALKAQQIENLSQKTLNEKDIKTNSSILISKSQRGQREALPNPMPEPVKEKKGALPNPMPKPVDLKSLPGDPKP